MTREELIKARKKLKKIVALTSSYADHAYGWDMEAEGDFNEWKDEIEAILLDEEDDD